MLDIPLVILAGGKSSRMGRDKALLPFKDEKTLTEYQLKRFTPYFRSVHISCKSSKKFNFEANFIEDDKEFDLSAPFVAILSSLEKLDSEYVAFISVDTPLIDPQSFIKLFSDLGSDGAVAKSLDGLEPLCAIYSKKITPILKELIEIKKLRFINLFEKIDLNFIEFFTKEEFTNLNTPIEYQICYKGFL